MRAETARTKQALEAGVTRPVQIGDLGTFDLTEDEAAKRLLEYESIKERGSADTSDYKNYLLEIEDFRNKNPKSPLPDDLTTYNKYRTTRAEILSGLRTRGAEEVKQEEYFTLDILDDARKAAEQNVKKPKAYGTQYSTPEEDAAYDTQKAQYELFYIRNKVRAMGENRRIKFVEMIDPETGEGGWYYPKGHPKAGQAIVRLPDDVARMLIKEYQRTYGPGIFWSE